jgi:hypothetical protein
MDSYLKGAKGVFTSDQVQKMRDQMDREAVPGESAENRANRAQEILDSEEARMGFSHQN